jgi:hypothetical protein
MGGNIGVHRLSWILANGAIPDGMSVLHRCDNPPCVNPEHLFLGTQRDNNLDMRAKGREGRFDRKGEANGHAKLTLSQAREIRARYASGGISQEALGRNYGIPQAHVSRIVLNRAWAEEV